MSYRPGPVSTRAAILAMWAHALRIQGRPVLTNDEIMRAARRWAREDRARGYRILPPERRPTGRPWSAP